MHQLKNILTTVLVAVFVLVVSFAISYFALKYYGGLI